MKSWQNSVKQLKQNPCINTSKMCDALRLVDNIAMKRLPLEKILGKSCGLSPEVETKKALQQDKACQHEAKYKANHDDNNNNNNSVTKQKV